MSELYRIFQSQKRYGKMIKDQVATREIRSKWTTVMGRLAKPLTLSYVRHGNMVLTTTNPMWVNEIQFVKDQIINAVNPILKGRYRIRDIRVVYAKEGSFQQRGGRQKRRPYSPESLLKRIQGDVNEKKKKGMTLCVICSEIYVKKGICSFCRTSSV